MSDLIILKRFKELGISAYEAKSYLSLLEKDTLTVTEVSRIAEIPRTNAYEALEKLLTRGLCISRPGKTKRYSASDPAFLQEKLSANLNKALKTELEHLNEDKNKILAIKKTAQVNLSDLVKELKPLYKNSRTNTNPLDYIEVIKDPHQIHNRVMKLFSQAKEEILVFTKPPFTGPQEKLEEQHDKEIKNLAIRKNLIWKSIYEIPENVEEKRWTLESIERTVKAGEQAKVLEELPMKMIICDSRIVVYALEDPVSKEISLTTQIIEHRSLAKSLRILFETLWEKAKDYHILKD